jgi:casein kinase 1
VSQHKELGSAALSAPHPYATAPSPTGYRNSPTFGRHSPSNVLGPNGNGLNGSDAVLYTQASTGKHDSPENTTLPGGAMRDGGLKGMGVYDREQMRRAEDQDEVHGRRKGFWGALCCRA